MSSSTKFNRLWGWSASCQQFTKVTAMVTIQQPVSVVDSVLGKGAYGIFVSLGTTSGRVVQNLCQLHPNFKNWRIELSDQNGQIDDTHGSSMVEPIPLDALDHLTPEWGVLLTVNQDLSGKYLQADLKFMKEIGTVNAGGIDGTHEYFPLIRPYNSYFVDTFNSVMVDVIGLGGDSEANFSQGQFDIEVFTDLQDIMYDGIDDVMRFTPPRPMCNGYIGNPNENSNLLKTVYEKGNGSLKVTASV